MGKRVVVGVLIVASACGSAKAITEPPTPVPATVPTAELNTPVMAPAPTEPPTTLAPEPTTAAVTTTEYLQPAATTRPPPAQTSLAYNGWAIPEYIVACETGGTFSWNAYNASSGASGPYQIMPEWFGGELAMNQSHASQHAMAARIWDNGRGASNWSQCL